MNQTLLNNLPPAELDQLDIGYMRLSDSAPLILAQHLGLYEKYGLDVSLHRETSWANIRDKTIAGAFDACQMLATMPLITTLGAAGLRAPLITGLVLSLNGDAITVSTILWKKMLAERQQSSTIKALESSRALKAVIDNKPTATLTFATVHSFSNHTLLLRKWLQASGINPDVDIRIITLPPEQMIDSLAQGIIDGFCAGSPWNTIAVKYGVGTIAATGFEIWNNAPGKVLGVLESWHSKHPTTHLRLRLALMEACTWLEKKENQHVAISTLARPEYLNLPEDYICLSLAGKLQHERDKDPQNHDNFHVFSRYCCGFPWRSQAELILTQFSPILGKYLEQEKLSALAQQCFRTDLYREAAVKMDSPCPNNDYKTEGQHAEPWLLDEGIELGSDLMLGN
jgi:ABC-type nitrate/sulfonate/bicarbonate transport system substrate-binding protein